MFLFNCAYQLTLIVKKKNKKRGIDFSDLSSVLSSVLSPTQLNHNNGLGPILTTGDRFLCRVKKEALKHSNFKKSSIPYPLHYINVYKYMLLLYIIGDRKGDRKGDRFSKKFISTNEHMGSRIYPLFSKGLT